MNVKRKIKPQISKKQLVTNDYDSNNLLLWILFLVLEKLNVVMIDTEKHVIVLGKMILEIIVWIKKYWDKLFGTFDAPPPYRAPSHSKGHKTTKQNRVLKKCVMFVFKMAS